MVGRVRLLPARPGRGGTVDRHGHARSGRRGPRGPPAPGRGHRVRHRRRRRGADQGVLRRPGALGAVAAARLPAGPGHRRGAARPTRRRSASSSAATASPPGARRATECEANSLEIIRTAQAFIDERGRAEPFGPVVAGLRGTAGRRSAGRGRPRSPRCSAGWPARTGRRSATSPTRDVGARLPVPGNGIRELAALGTSCPDHFLRTKVRPHGARPAAHGATVEIEVARLRELHAAYREEYAAYYAAPRRARLAGHARRRPGHRPRPGRRHVLLRREQADRPGRRRVLRQRHQRHARRRGDLHATRRSTRSEKFRIEYWALEEAKLARLPKPKPLATRVAAGHRRRVGHRPRHRAPARRRGRLRRGRRPRRRGGRTRSPPSSARPTWRCRVVADVTDDDRRRRAGPRRVRSPSAASTWS